MGVMRHVGALASAAAVLGAAPAWADDAGAGKAETAGVSEPAGREVAPRRQRPAPEAVPVVACSFDRPICVHAAKSVHPRAVLATLEGAERAMRGYDALRLPRPLPDDGLGGSDAWDVYLVKGTEPASEVDLLARAEPFDRLSAFAILPPPGERSGCEAARDVAHALADAIAFRLDAGIEASSLAMSSGHLASLVAPCPNAEAAAIDELQRVPERAMASGAGLRLHGSYLFPELLDERYGGGTPGQLFTSLVAIARQKTPPGAWQWHNEPDVFDALRITRKAQGASLDALLLELAVSRAFLGSRSDGAHLADVAWLGAAGRVRFDWALPYTSLPRRVAPAAPIEATGAIYLWIDLADAPIDASLTFAADWELPTVFSFALVKVDDKGAETGRVVATAPHGETHVEKSLRGLGGLAGVVVVGANAGSMDRAEPYDPDDSPVGHGVLVTVYR
jgi:hypothetical protein